MTWAAIGHVIGTATVLFASMGAMYRMTNVLIRAYERQMEAAREHSKAVNGVLEASRRVDEATADVGLRARVAYAMLSDIAVTRRALAVPVLLPLALDVLRLEWTGGRYVDPAPRFDRPSAPPRAIELD